MKRKPGPGTKVYKTALERDQATKLQRTKADPYPGLGSKEPSSVSRWVENTVNPERDIMSVVKTLATSQSRRLYENTLFMSLYENDDFMSPYFGTSGGAGNGSNAGAAGGNTSGPRMSDNQLRMCTDALAGKLIQSNSRIVLQTRMGDFSEWKKARKIEMALEGEFAKMRLYREVQQVVTDAITIGDGYLKLYPDYENKSICAERVFPNEIFIDELEGAYGPVKKMYQLQYRRKDDIYSWYPDKIDIIRKAATTMPPRFAWTLYQPGMVEIYEAWALPVGDKPGRHIIAVSSGTLVDEPWDKPYFPITHFKAANRPFGWYGSSWAKQVASTQIDLNKTWNVLQRSAHMGIAPYIIVQDGSSINIDHLVNDVATIVTTASADPKWVVNPPFHPAAKDYLDSLKTTIMTFFGMNEMEVTGELPINRLDSSEALREFQTMGSVRHTQILELWQEFFVDVAQRVCMLASDIAKKNGGYPVMIKKAYAKAVQLDWQDLEIDKDAYMMSPAPANVLPITSAGRVNKISELKADGLISPQQAARAIASGQDVEGILAEVTADEDDIDRLIEQFTEHEEYRAPTSLMNLPLAIARVGLARNKYANLGADQSVLALFERFLSEAKDLTVMLTPPQPQGMPPNGSNGSPSPGSPPPSPAGGPAGPGGPPPGASGPA